MTTSVIDGGPAPALDVSSLADLLPRAASRNQGTAVHLITADGVTTSLSYSDLLDAASRVLGGLRLAGVRPGDRVVLHLRDNRDFLPVFWACVLGGFVAVPTSADPSGLRPDQGYLWLVADAPARSGPQWIGTARGLDAGSPDRRWFRGDLDDIALLATTAGSTGAPKTVRLSHRNILSRSAATIADNGLDATAVTFNSMPLDHVGGLVMFHLRDVQLACTQVHAHRDWILGDPARWLDIADHYRATVAWGTTSALDAIAARASAGLWDLRRLVYVMNGGEPVKARTINRFLTALAPFGLPGDAVRPGWGMSETAAGVVDHRLSRAELHDDRYVPVGRPHPGVAVRVVDLRGDLAGENVVGRLQVRGASVTTGYADGHPDNVTAFTSDGWLDTGDYARVSGGLLTVTGSTADALWIDGELHHAHEIESTVGELPFVDRRFVGAFLADGSLTVAYHGTEENESVVRAAVLAAHGLHADRVVLLPPDAFPKTRTGKPQRAQLREITTSFEESRVRHN